MSFGHIIIYEFVCLSTHDIPNVMSRNDIHSLDDTPKGDSDKAGAPVEEGGGGDVDNKGGSGGFGSLPSQSIPSTT
jgi:hypothetical protein